MSRTLVVDPDVNVQMLLNAVLARDGHQVEFAGDGKQCWQKLRESVYAAILMELYLPEMDGLELLDRLAEENPDVVRRVIVVSSAHETMLRKVEKHPVHAVVRKPFDIGEIEAIVRTCASSVCEDRKP